LSRTTLGIMMLYVNKHKKIEEKVYFRKLLAAADKLGLDAFIFSPADVKQKRIYIHYYDQNSVRWRRKWSAFPTIIFDRCRYQPTARFKQLRRFRARHPHLTYMNRPLANKWVIHQTLWKNPQIRPNLPPTTIYRTNKDVFHMLTNHRTVYLKPTNGTGGRGILRIQKSGNGLYHIQGRDRQRRMIKPRRVNYSQLLAVLKSWRVLKPLLIQQGIAIKLDNGRVHDYRLLMQKNGSGEWTVTGCAGRMGSKRSITSNLHGGGKALPMNALLKHWFTKDTEIETIRQSVYTLGHSVTTEIERRYGKLCELALDIAIDRSGHVWLLEINPKPSREVFSRIGERDTYEKAINRPLEYALWLAKQK
jgi:glutathione synthase/RimK-type ligase-like ATP-grasp enzyme